LARLIASASVLAIAGFCLMAYGVAALIVESGRPELAAETAGPPTPVPAPIRVPPGRAKVDQLEALVCVLAHVPHRAEPRVWRLYRRGRLPMDPACGG
jgi:hypothetical protein